MLQDFIDKSKNLKIISEEKLAKYFNFCIENNQKERIKGKTAAHHILPQRLFPERSNANNNKWNICHLFYSDHYYAHWLFTEAVDDHSQLYAFCTMHFKDVKIGRIQESDLISAEEFQIKMEERNKKFSEWDKENGHIRKNKQSKTKQSKEWKETIGIRAIEKRKVTEKENNTLASRIAKFKETIHKVQSNGLTINEEIQIKRMKTMKENDLYKQASEKQKKIRQSKEWKETVGKQASIKRIKSIKKNRETNPSMYSSSAGENNYATKIIEIYNAFDKLEFVSKGSFSKFIEDNNLPISIWRATKEDPMYSSNKTGGVSKERVKKYKGWYIKVI